MPQSAILWLQCLGLSSAESAATLEAAEDVPGDPFCRDIWRKTMTSKHHNISVIVVVIVCVFGRLHFPEKKLAKFSADAF